MAVALEQLRTFRSGGSQEALGPTERVGLDGFPMLAGSELRAEHEAVSAILQAIGGARDRNAPAHNPLTNTAAVRGLLEGGESDTAARTRLVLALIERIFAFDACLSTPEGDRYRFSHFFDYGDASRLMAALMRAGVDTQALVEPLLEWFNCYRFAYYGTPPVAPTVDWVASEFAGKTIPEPLRSKLMLLRGQCTDLARHNTLGASLMKQVDEILGPGPWQIFSPAEVWTIAALKEVENLPPPGREAWIQILSHCATATAARPSAKWLKTGRGMLAKVGAAAYRAALLRWFPLVDAGRPAPMASPSWENIDERGRMHEVNATILRGLLWLSPDVADVELTRAIARLALSAYRKIRGIGPRAPKVGNAVVYALSQIPTPDAVGQLALLKVRVKFGTAQKEIEKAFTAAAAALNLPRDQIEELGVPTYGLETVGQRRERFADGEFVAELRVDGNSAELHWFRADGKPQKSIPARVKADHKEELKELQGAVKDIAAMLPAQSERLDSMFLLEKSWPQGIWHERYLNHPLVGTLARRLIWTVSAGSIEQAVLFADGGFQTVTGAPASIASDAVIRLWHPIGRDVDEVLAWRARLEALRITQPFKQAHREVYLLTEAERNTRTYSNRFAAHIIRQHQFHALAAARGWRNKLRLMVDDFYPPATRELPAFGLRAEFWVEGIGDSYGTDTTDSGAYLRLSTDQVRFYESGAAQRTAHAGGGGYGPARWGNTEDAEPIPLDRVPALAFSEVMRDVDLFVGVASVANDPNWSDGGPEGTYRDYWREYAFGDLSASAETRKAVLATLLPRMTKLKGRWALDEGKGGRFLRIRGKLRSYKIHLGSGNILMEPNDQYLCIVPDSRARSAATPAYLPFEGDNVLSIVLSKALLLVEDDQITDPTITRQLAIG